MFAFDSNQLQSLVSKLFRFALRIMSPLTAAASLKLIRADDPFIAVILCSSIKLVAAQQLQSICHAHMPVDYSKWATIVVSDSDDIDDETSSDQDGEADKSHQPQTHAAALDGRPEPAFAAEEPGREKIADMCELVELLTTGAFDNEKVDQGKLATAWMHQPRIALPGGCAERKGLRKIPKAGRNAVKFCPGILAWPAFQLIPSIRTMESGLAGPWVESQQAEPESKECRSRWCGFHQNPAPKKRFSW